MIPWPAEAVNICKDAVTINKVTAGGHRVAKASDIPRGQIRQGSSVTTRYVTSKIDRLMIDDRQVNRKIGAYLYIRE